MNLRELLILKAASGGGSPVEMTATGNPVAFTTKLAKPLNSITVPLSYTQSGTGDPSPSNIRPISGVSSLSAYRTGINIFDEEFEEGMLNDSTGQDRPSSANIRSKNYISVVPGKKYYFKYKTTSGTNMRIFLYYADKSYKSNQWSGVTSLTIPADVHYVRFYMDTSYSASGDRKISINYPYTETDYVPYSGGVKLDVVFPPFGKNLCPPPVKGVGVDGSDGHETTSATRATTDYIPVDFITNANYRFSGLPDTLTSWINGYNANKEFVGRTSSAKRIAYTISSDKFDQGAPTHTGDVAFVRLTFSAGSGASIDDVDSASIQLEVGDTTTAYEPYCDAVYGGSLDLVSGVLTIDFGSVDIGSLTWEDRTNGNVKFFYSSEVPDAKPVAQTSEIANIACDRLKTATGQDVYNGAVDNAIGANSTSNPRYRAIATGYEDASEFKTAMNGVMLYYELKTPITVQLTPNQINAIKGNNTIWTDTTGDLTIKYLDKA